MKFLMIAVLIVGVMSFTGCRYGDVDNSRNGASSSNEAFGIDSDVEEIDESAQEGSIDELSSHGKNFEDLYTRVEDVSFAPVFFGFDASLVPQDELGKVDAVATHLAEHSNRVVVIEGHCDERGSNEYNMSLGEIRAQSLRNYLVQSGITEDRIQTRSYGEERPLIHGVDESAWAKNRRGEFVIFRK